MSDKAKDQEIIKKTRNALKDLCGEDYNKDKENELTDYDKVFLVDVENLLRYKNNINKENNMLLQKVGELEQKLNHIREWHAKNYAKALFPYANPKKFNPKFFIGTKDMDELAEYFKDEVSGCSEPRGKETETQPEPLLKKGEHFLSHEEVFGEKVRKKVSEGQK